MKQNSIHFYSLFLIGLIAFSAGCSDRAGEDLVFHVTQAQLDAATLLPSSLDTAIVGDPFNGFPNDTLTLKHKLRDLFANIPLTKDVEVGTIMVRRAFYYPWKEYKRDSLLNIVVMVKREAGYYPEGGDWEYMDIKYNKNTNYGLNPNGLLPDVTNAAVRGKIVKCATCHAGSGSNFLFHREK